MKDSYLNLHSVPLPFFARTPDVPLISLVRDNEAPWGPTLFRGNVLVEFVYHSPSPVLIYPHTCLGDFLPKRIFFSTDFSPKSESLFLHTLKLAKLAQAELVLFFQLGDLNGSYPVRANAGSKALIQSLAGGLGKEWQARARNAGVVCHFQIGEATGKLSDIILNQAAANECELVALACQSSRLRACFFGSVTWAVIRKSPMPVLTWKS